MTRTCFETLVLLMLSISLAACGLGSGDGTDGEIGGRGNQGPLTPLPDEGPGVCDFSRWTGDRGVDFSGWNSNCAATSLGPSVTAMTDDGSQSVNLTFGSDGLLTSVNGVDCCLDHARADGFDASEFFNCGQYYRCGGGGECNHHLVIGDSNDLGRIWKLYGHSQPNCGGERGSFTLGRAEAPDYCIPRCTGRSCGDDNCGGSCGSCDSGSTCRDGRCVDPNACPSGCQQGRVCCGPPFCAGDCVGSPCCR